MTSVWLPFKGENRLFESPIPAQGGIGIPCIDIPIQKSEIPLSVLDETNDVCHALLRNLRRTPVPDAPCLASHLPGPAGCLRLRRREQQCRAGVDRQRRPE